MGFGTKVVLLSIVAVLLSVMLQPKFDPKSLKGKSVIVTGASQGIGESMAYEYSRLGARVMVIARSKDKLVKVVEKCKKLGAQSADYIAADLSTDNDDVFAELINESVQGLGGQLDTLVLNHIVTTDTFLKEGWMKKRDMSTVRWMFNVNTFSYLALATHAIDHLEKTAGNIIVVSSGAGIVGLPYVVPYSGSKHALHGFFNSLRIELAILKSPVKITTCVIGNIDTESNRKNMGDNSPVLAPRYPREDCAKAIIQGGETRIRTVYFPFMQVYPLRVMSGLPSLADFVILTTFS